MALHRLILKTYGIGTPYTTHRGGTAVTFEGAQFAYNTAKFGATGNLDVVEHNENATRHALFARLTADDVFYDIGAHGGVFTITAQHRVPGLTVLSFEPQPTELLTNLELNGMTTDRVFQVAVGDAPGKVRMTSDQRSSNHLSESGDIEVDCVRLDDFRATHDLPAPNWIKIDIEGMELPALSGFAETLKAAKPVVICEINHVFDRFGASLPDLIGFFTALDYAILAKTGTGFAQADATAQDLKSLGRSLDENFWFVPTEKLGAFLE